MRKVKEGNIGNLLKKMRKSKGKSATHTSKLIGKDPRTFSGWEKGYHNLSAASFIEICIALEITDLTEFLVGEKKKKEINS